MEKLKNHKKRRLHLGFTSDHLFMRTKCQADTFVKDKKCNSKDERMNVELNDIIKKKENPQNKK